MEFILLGKGLCTKNKLKILSSLCIIEWALNEWIRNAFVTGKKVWKNTVRRRQSEDGGKAWRNVVTKLGMLEQPLEVERDKEWVFP